VETKRKSPFVGHEGGYEPKEAQPGWLAWLLVAMAEAKERGGATIPKKEKSASGAPLGGSAKKIFPKGARRKKRRL
jgi:hypothetical protein